MDIPQEVIDAFDALFPGHGPIEVTRHYAGSPFPISFTVTFAGEKVRIARYGSDDSPFPQWRAQGAFWDGKFSDSPLGALHSVVSMIVSSVQLEATTATKRANNAIEYANKVNANAELWANVAKMVQA